MNWLEQFGLEPHECKSIKPGDRFGRITILATGKLANRKYIYKSVYRCDCGTVAMTANGTIQIGTTRSCGCKNREESTSHGMAGTTMYNVWKNMMDRCYNEECSAYSNYGGRGIRVCERWHDPLKFKEDMQPSYAAGLTLDRIDNGGNYTPENCQWATRDQQAKNRRNCLRITIDGRTQVLKDWCREFHVPYSLVYYRVKEMGWEPLKALQTPSRRALVS